MVSKKINGMPGDIRVLKQISVFLLLFLVLSFTNCSSDIEPSKEDTSTASFVELPDGNPNTVIGGLLSIGFHDSPQGYAIDKLVDADDSTFFCSPRNSITITWKANQAMVASYYSLTSANERTRDPRAWTLSASNDSTTWTLLDTQSDVTFQEDIEKKQYYLENDAAFTYYKLDVHSSSDTILISELSLLSKINPDLPYSIDVSDENENMPTAGRLTSQYSDSPESETIQSLIDGNIATSFKTGHSQFYLLWKGTQKISVNYYSITAGAGDAANDPKSWELTASSDSVNWTVLDTRTDVDFSNRGETKEYVLSNKNSYRYYKLNVTANHGGDTTDIAEWTLKHMDVDISALMIYSNGSTYTSLTPMGTRFANQHVTTESDKVWLATATNEPALLASSSSLTQMKAFNVTLYPYGSPAPADVNQHAIGDCSACAVFASFAYLYPDFIKAIITDNGDKTYTVAMFDPQGNPVDVTVTSKFLADAGGTIGAVTGKSNVPTWSTVLEKAMMKWQKVYKVNEDIGGIGTEHVAPLFTGNGDSFAFSANVLSSQNLKRAVEASLMQGKIVVGGFTQGDVWVSGTHKTVTSHAFTLMYSQDASALFSMRNPWGGDDDGVYNIPNNSVIPPLIDLRIVNAGKAAQYSKGLPGPYVPPYLSPAQKTMRVSPELLRSGK